MASSHVAESILSSIRKSKLNFVISETHSYSVQICMRKRFRKDADISHIEPVESSEKVSEKVSETPNKLMKDIEVLKNGFASMEKSLRKQKT